MTLHNIVAIFINRKLSWKQLMLRARLIVHTIPGLRLNEVIKYVLDYYKKLLIIGNNIIVINKNVYPAPRREQDVLIYTGFNYYYSIDHDSLSRNTDTKVLYYTQPGGGRVIIKFIFKGYYARHLAEINIKFDGSVTNIFNYIYNYMSKYDKKIQHMVFPGDVYITTVDKDERTAYRAEKLIKKISYYDYDRVIYPPLTRSRRKHLRNWRKRSPAILPRDIVTVIMKYIITPQTPVSEMFELVKIHALIANILLSESGRILFTHLRGIAFREVIPGSAHTKGLYLSLRNSHPRGIDIIYNFNCDKLKNIMTKTSHYTYYGEIHMQEDHFSFTALKSSHQGKTRKIHIHKRIMRFVSEFEKSIHKYKFVPVLDVSTKFYVETIVLPERFCEKLNY